MERRVFALIIPRFEDIFHSYYASEIIRGVGMSASHLQVDFLVHITERSGHQDWLRSPNLNPRNIDGLLFADIDGDYRTLLQVLQEGIPTLVLNNFFEQPINCIAIDNYRAAYEAARYLVSLGHSQIATIAGDLNTQSGRSRLSGYEEALKASGIQLRSHYVRCGDYLRSASRKAAEQLLKLKDRPTAIFAASDVMALELMDVARDRGIEIPNELSVVGFDDNPLNHYSPVPLTTLRQPLVEMATLGLSLLEQIVSGQVLVPVKRVLSAKLIKRKSCARVGKKFNSKGINPS